jgi:hypothetical protein
MKHAKCLNTVAAVIIGMGFVVNLPLHAQSLAMKVTIPFEFHAGDKALPAGTYTVEKRGEAVLISDGRGNTAAVIANAIRNKAYRMENMLVFKRYGETRFLTEVRWSDYSTARGLMESPAERQIAKALAADSVNVAATIR